MASAIDLLPTLAGIAGIPLDGQHPIDGRDLGPAIFAATTFPRELYFRHQSGVALRRGKWKLLNGSLYDLERDPGETTDVSAANAAVLSDLSARVKAIERAISERRPVPGGP